MGGKWALEQARACGSAAGVVDVHYQIETMKENVQRVFRKRYLIVKVLFQIGILVGMVLLAMRPLVDGREIRLVVQSRDPRALFRGDYVQLNYEFSTIDLDSIPNDLDSGRRYKFGDELYLEMKQRGRFYRPVGLWSSPPRKNLFMKVMVNYHMLAINYGAGTKAEKPQRARGTVSLTGGIEQYYTNPASAKEFDVIVSRSTTDSVQVVAYVMVSDDGESRIKKLRYGVFGE